MGERQPAETSDVWSAHQLLAFSGLDGATSWDADLTATLQPGRVGLRLESEPPQLVTLLLDDRPIEPETLRTCSIRDGQVIVSLTCSGLAAEVRWGLATQDALVLEVRGTGAQRLTAAIERIDAKKPAIQGARLASGRELVEPSKLILDFDTGRTRAGGVARAALFRSLDSSAGRPLPHLPPPFEVTSGGWPAAVERTRLKALAILRQNILGPEGPFTGRWMTAQRREHRALNSFHLPFCLLAVAELDSSLPGELLDSLLEQQGPRGLIPSRIWPAGRTAVCGPPLLCWAVQKLLGAGRALDLPALLPALKAYVKHPLGARMLSRHGFARSRGSRLLSWGHGEGSGMDNSPRLEHGEPFAAVDLNALAAAELERFACLLAAGEPDHREAKHYAWLGEELAAESRDYLWDDEGGRFVDRYADDEPVAANTIAGLLPLFAGLADGPQAERIVREHLHRPERFWTALPLASLAADDPRCDANQWRGAVWPALNLLVIEGLRRYGYADLAAELRRRTVDAIVRWYNATGTLWQFYDPHDERSPADLPRGHRVGAHPEYAWTAAAFCLLLQED